MTVPGVVEPAVADSTGDSPVGDTSTDTGAEGSHETESVDVESLVAQLERNADKIPSDRLAFLDRKFQPDYTRKLNALLKMKTDMDESVKKSVAESGVTVPEDFSIFKDDGKPFLEHVLKTVREEVAPVRNMIEVGKRNEQIRGYMEAAKEMYPEVGQNFEEARKLIDSDPTLLALAHAFEGKAVPIVLKGAAQAVMLEKTQRENAELKEKLRKRTVGEKVGTDSSKTGGKVMGSEGKKPSSVKDFVTQSLQSILEGGSAS